MVEQKPPKLRIRVRFLYSLPLQPLDKPIFSLKAMRSQKERMSFEDAFMVDNTVSLTYCLEKKFLGVVIQKDYMRIIIEKDRIWFEVDIPSKEQIRFRNISKLILKYKGFNRYLDFKIKNFYALQETVPSRFFKLNHTAAHINKKEFDKQLKGIKHQINKFLKV